MRFAWSLSLALTTAAAAQELAPTPMPAPGHAPATGLDWRPIVYSDPAAAAPDDPALAELWSDEIAANDLAYRAAGDTRYDGGHAPATEAHFVVRSTQRTVVLSMLNTAFGCQTQYSDAIARVAVRRCPLKIAVFDGATRTVTSGRHGCVLETLDHSADPEISRTAAAYDVASRSIRIGTLIDHEPVAGCADNIPVFAPVLR